MLLFAFLLMVAIVLIFVTVCAIIAGGITVVLAFGDVIVCGLLIYLILRWLTKRRLR